MMSDGSPVTGIEALETDPAFFAKSGPLPTAFEEERRFPRFYYRARLQAAIYPLGASGQPPAACSLLARDLSRGGMNLIHSEQVYPGQRIDVALTDGSLRSLEVTWCRRLDNQCYTLGCRFIKTAEGPTDNAAAAPAATVPKSSEGTGS
jgi:hypothetical protein